MKMVFDKDVVKEYKALTQRKVELASEVEKLNEGLVTIKEVSATLQAEIEQEIAEATEKVAPIKEEVAGLESTATNLNQALKDELETAWTLREHRYAWFSDWADAEAKLLEEASQQKRQELLVADKTECERWTSEVKRTNVINFINSSLDEATVTSENASEVIKPLVENAIDIQLELKSKTWQRLNKVLSKYWRDLSSDLRAEITSMQAKPKNNSVAKAYKDATR